MKVHLFGHMVCNTQKANCRDTIKCTYSRSALNSESVLLCLSVSVFVRMSGFYIYLVAKIKISTTNFAEIWEIFAPRLVLKTLQWIARRKAEGVFIFLGKLTLLTVLITHII